MKPHDTGKVQIGKHYVPLPANDPDMDRLQTALCPPMNRRNLLREVICDSLMLAAFVAGITLMIHAPQIWNSLT